MKPIALLGLVLPLCFLPFTVEVESTGAGQVSLSALTPTRVVLDATPPTSTPGRYAFRLRGPLGELAAMSGRHTGRPFAVRLDAEIDTARKPLYVVEWSYDDRPAERRSLYFLAPILETVIVAPRDYLAGTTPVFRVVVHDRAAGQPVEGAAVEASIVTGDDQRAVFRGTSDRDGVVRVKLPLSSGDTGDHRLLVRVSHRGQTDELNEPIRVQSAARTLLTTDKPLYQPGQTIHMRALTLLRPQLSPAAGAEVVFEVEDAKGNKVFKARRTSDAFGTAHADFVLADELNEGAYKVRAVVAGAPQEKTVTVERYVLPKFKIAFSTDRPYYEPGSAVTGDLQVDYFFGKPVAGARVAIDCSKFDVGFQSFQTIEGTTDEAGHFSWSAQLPEHFVGQPLLDGKAFAQFDVRVNDTADHTEEIARNVTVSASPLMVGAVPESGRLVPGLPNRIFLVTTYADGSPVAATLDWRLGGSGAWSTVASDEAGFAEIEVTGPAGASSVLELRVADARGNRTARSFTLESQDAGRGDHVLLRLDRALFRVGETIRARALTSVAQGTVYFDVVKDGQTWLTRLGDLEGGEAGFELTPDAGLSGTLTLSAYLIGRDGEIVRDQRVVVVTPADEISIRMVPAADTYRPGGTAAIDVRTTDRHGRGVPAALVVSIVDEAVFALQEMQPGLEKIYYYLEQEIAKPRYEIHGLELPDVVRPAIDDAPERRDRAAVVLLAAAEGADAAPGIEVNTFVRDGKGAEYQRIAGEALQDNYAAVQKAMEKYARYLKLMFFMKRDDAYTLEDLAKRGYLDREDLIDPWGGTPRMVDGEWCQSCQLIHGWVLESDGPDLVPGTADDVRYGAFSHHGWGGKMRRQAFLGDEMRMAQPMAAGAVMQEMDAAAPEKKGEAGRNDADPGEPRVRRYFPETLWWQPALITDRRGRARMEVPLADSITTWRMTALASSRSGLLGSSTASLRVFQDFFVDIDFPVSLTQNDRVWVPVAVYNYLETEQSVRLVVQPGDWFELQGSAETVLDVGPGQVVGVKFPIRVKGIGNHRFTVKAYGSEMSDAVERGVEVVPDGQEQLVAAGGRLEGVQTPAFRIPSGAIAGATRAHVKVYPGVFSQLIEGLDKILRMPSGCFEQTSSATYPNVLVLNYMKTTGIETPELRMKAEGFINNGYQRLLSFEVPGGGFEWFGNTPAHRILTAYGLMEFHDMSQVFEVDPAVIARTQNWLVAQQDRDGSWKPSQGGIQEGAINRFTDDVYRNTSYIALALASTGYRGEALVRAEGYLAKHLDEVEDTYTLALTVNTMASIDPKHRTLDTLVGRLLDRRVADGDVVYWKSGSATPTHGSGAVADIEVTGWAVMGLVRTGYNPAVVSRAVSWLVEQKDAFGTWQSTQATIIALKAMILAEKEGSEPADATIAIVVNGRDVREVRVQPDDSDVLRMIDITPYLTDGDNDCRIEMRGTGSLFYQVSANYWTPHAPQPDHSKDPLAIEVGYDRTELATNDVVHATVRVKNRTAARMNMVLVDVGIPPGFTVLPDDLEQAVTHGVIEKFTLTGRQITLYLDALRAKQTLEIGYDLVARFPVRVKTPRAVAYQYYEPDVRAEAGVRELVVVER